MKVIEMEDWLRDVKRALRVLLHSPAFTVAALAALALGIGANTAVFSMVNTVLLKPLNVPDADRIVQFMLNYGGMSYPGGSPHQIYYWRQQTGVAEDVSALRLELLNLGGGREPRQMPVARVSAEFFHLFGATLARGRVFNSDEDRPGGQQVAVLSHSVWTGRFGGNPGVIGQTVSLSGEPYIVIGILGPGFNSEQ